MKKRRLLSALAALLLVALLAGCGDAPSLPEAGAANPMVAYESLGEAGEALGFTAALPTPPNNYNLGDIYVIGGTVLHVIFRNAEEQEIIFRAAKTEDEITGVYAEYDYEETAELAGQSVALQGNDEDAVYVAAWQQNGVQCALLFEAPVTTGQVGAMLYGVSFG